MLALFVVHDVPVTATPLEHTHIFVAALQRHIELALQFLLEPLLVLKIGLLFECVREHPATLNLVFSV